MNNTRENTPNENISYDEIVKNHAPLVKKIAINLSGKLPANIQTDDLVQVGMIGLLDAAKKYDESKGASFATYAGIRIRGAMMDEVRRGAWAPRSVHSNSRKIAKAINSIENTTGRDAHGADVAKALNISLEDYYKMQQETNTSNIFGLDDAGVMLDQVGGDTTTGYAAGPYDELQNNNFKQLLAKNIATLPAKEKLVLALYYQEELNLKEVGAVMRVSESRISQIHSQAMQHLQSKVSNNHI